MARRSRSSFNPIWMLIGAAVLIGAFLVARSFVGASTEPFRTHQSLDVASYLENANSLRGNVYKLRGEVMNALALSPSEGRLFSFGVNNNSDVVPVLIPTELNHINIQKGQRFILLLEVMDDGILRAKEMTKA